MPLPPTVSCFTKIHIGFTFLVPAHLGSPGKRAIKRVCVCVCVCVAVAVTWSFISCSLLEENLLRWITQAFTSLSSPAEHIIAVAPTSRPGKISHWPHAIVIYQLTAEKRGLIPILYANFATPATHWLCKVHWLYVVVVWDRLYSGFVVTLLCLLFCLIFRLHIVLDWNAISLQTLLSSIYTVRMQVLFLT